MRCSPYLRALAQGGLLCRNAIIQNIWIRKYKQGNYRRYKGKEYEVIRLAHHSETLEPFVVYKALYDSDEFGLNAIWVRPFAMFTEKVEVDNKQILRFEYVK